MATEKQLPSLEQMAETARGLANDLFSGVDCCEMKHGRPSCIQTEEDRPLTKEEKAKDWARRPFYAYQAARMCDGCASYWWAEMAAQTLHRLNCSAIRAEALRKVKAAQ